MEGIKYFLYEKFVSNEKSLKIFIFLCEILPHEKFQLQ